MKKIIFPKIRTRKIDIKYVLNYIGVILLTSAILVSILIALPLTERISSNVTYDLNTKKDLYWAKEYTLEIDNFNSENREKEIDKIMSVIFKRVSRVGVEKLDMSRFAENEKEYISILIQTSQPQEYIDELVRNPFIINVVDRKEDVNFEDPENPYAIYLSENYNETEYSRNSFRNIYITQLKNSSNEYSYFALFKTWPWNTKWSTYLSDNAGREVGVSIDGFVTPVQIPAVQPYVFALPISTTEKKEAELITILYNSGVVPVTYTVIDQQEKPVENIEVDYVKIIEGVIVAVLAIYAYLYFVNKTDRKVLLVGALTSLLTISLWIAYLKISALPIDTFILTIEVIMMIALLRITTENTESRIIVNVLLALIASIVAILGTGYGKILASHLFFLLILGNISEQIALFYTYKVRKLLKI